MGAPRANAASAGEFRQPWVLFTSGGLRRVFEKAGLAVVVMAASNPVVSEGAQIPKIASNPAAGEALTALELALCTSPGMVDAGEHLLAVADKM